MYRMFGLVQLYCDLGEKFQVYRLYLVEKFQVYLLF